MSRSILWAMLLAILASPFVAAAQPDKGDSAAREKAFIEALRREDPASADRFIALRDAQQKALAELQSTESRANAVPPVLRPSFLPQLKQARQKYVDSYGRLCHGNGGPRTGRPPPEGANVAYALPPFGLACLRPKVRACLIEPDRLPHFVIAIIQFPGLAGQ